MRRVESLLGGNRIEFVSSWITWESFVQWAVSVLQQWFVVCLDGNHANPKDRSCVSSQRAYVSNEFGKSRERDCCLGWVDSGHCVVGWQRWIHWQHDSIERASERCQQQWGIVVLLAGIGQLGVHGSLAGVESFHGIDSRRNNVVWCLWHDGRWILLVLYRQDDGRKRQLLLEQFECSTVSFLIVAILVVTTAANVPAVVYLSNSIDELIISMKWMCVGMVDSLETSRLLASRRMHHHSQTNLTAWTFSTCRSALASSMKTLPSFSTTSI